jgi:hypothetical protein
MLSRLTCLPSLLVSTCRHLDGLCHVSGCVIEALPKQVQHIDRLIPLLFVLILKHNICVEKDKAHADKHQQTGENRDHLTEP